MIVKHCEVKEPFGSFVWKVSFHQSAVQEECWRGSEQVVHSLQPAHTPLLHICSPGLSALLKGMSADEGRSIIFAIHYFPPLCCCGHNQEIYSADDEAVMRACNESPSPSPPICQINTGLLHILQNMTVIWTNNTCICFK